MPQTSIPDTMEKAYAGQVAEAYAPRFARAGAAEGAAIVQGMPVKRGTRKQDQVEPFEAGDAPSFQNFAGVVALDTTRAYNEDGIEDADSLDILRLGTVYMDFSEAVTAGEAVGLTLATGLLTGIPDGTAAGAIAAGIVVLPGLRIVETTSAADLAAVEVNLFGAQIAATVGTL